MKEMTSPIQAIGPAAVLAAATLQDSEFQDAPSHAPAASAPPVPASSTSSPDPLELSIEKGANGIFVYSLKDPSTGRLIAVIPTDHASGAAGPGYQAGEYVSVST